MRRINSGYESEDLNSWNRLTNIFYCSGTEGWVRGSLWQPQIVAGSDGKFYLYYCGQNDDKSLNLKFPFISEKTICFLFDIAKLRVHKALDMRGFKHGCDHCPVTL